MSNLEPEITVVNAYGQTIPGVEARYHEKGRSSGRPLRVELTAPGYVKYSFWRFLEAVDTETYMLLIDPRTALGPKLPNACLFNLSLAAAHTYLQDKPVSRYISGNVIEKRQDRAYFSVRHAEEFLRALDCTGSMAAVVAMLHHPHEEGYEIVGSWKTTRGAPVFQVTMWKKTKRDWLGGPESDSGVSPYTTTHYVAELDLDLRSGLGHVGEVLKNLVTGGKTNAYLVNQALAWSWGLHSFTLMPRIDQ
jgi:hypothetical protein